MLPFWINLGWTAPPIYMSLWFVLLFTMKSFRRNARFLKYLWVSYLACAAIELANSIALIIYWAVYNGSPENELALGWHKMYKWIIALFVMFVIFNFLLKLYFTKVLRRYAAQARTFKDQYKTITSLD